MICVKLKADLAFWKVSTRICPTGWIASIGRVERIEQRLNLADA
jgi:hypothetical protein